MSEEPSTTRDARARLIGGTYRPPVVETGDWLDDEIDGRVEVGGYSRGRVPWPRRLKTGKPSLILCGDLVRAVRTESAVAIAHHFGVSSGTVHKWRMALGVDRRNNAGTMSLYRNRSPESSTPASTAQDLAHLDSTNEDSMTRPPSESAETSAERKRKMRLRQVARGQVRCSIELSAEAREKVDRAAEAGGRTRTEIVNALILDVLP